MVSGIGMPSSKSPHAIDGLGDDIFGYGQNGWWGPYGYWMNAAGGGFFNEDRTACALDTPESLAGLAFEQRIYTEFDVAVPYGEDQRTPVPGRQGRHVPERSLGHARRARQR